MQRSRRPSFHDISFYFSPGSTVAYIVMDFDQPLTLAEQSQITYAIQEGVMDAGSEVSLI